MDTMTLRPGTAAPNDNRAGVSSVQPSWLHTKAARLCAVRAAANRTWTFGVSGPRRVATHHGQAQLVLAITWAATSAALWLLVAVAPGAGAAGQTVVLAGPTRSRPWCAS
jgi:hypothetical protein